MRMDLETAEPDQLTKALSKVLRGMAVTVLEHHESLLSCRERVWKSDPEGASRPINNGFRVPCLDDELAQKYYGLTEGAQAALLALLYEPSIRALAPPEVVDAATMRIGGDLLRAIAVRLLGDLNLYADFDAADKASRNKEATAAKALGISLATFRKWFYLGIPEAEKPRVVAFAASIGLTEGTDYLR